MNKTILATIINNAIEEKSTSLNFIIANIPLEYL